MHQIEIKKKSFHHFSRVEIETGQQQQKKSKLLVFEEYTREKENISIRLDHVGK